MTKKKERQVNDVTSCAYPVLADVDVPETGVEQQLVGVNVDGALEQTFLTQAPLLVHRTPVVRTCDRQIQHISYTRRCTESADQAIRLCCYAVGCDLTLKYPN